VFVVIRCTLAQDSPRDAGHSWQRNAVLSWRAAGPCTEAGGLIFAYLGPGDPPLLPAYPWLTSPAERCHATKVCQECNYLQGEANIDPQHLSFLHRISREAAQPRSAARIDTRPVMATDPTPTMEVEETEYGHRTFAVRGVGDDRRLESGRAPAGPRERVVSDLRD
jgi:phthalate 4,5-dioxygenase oxygenase subunit